MRAFRRVQLRLRPQFYSIRHEGSFSASETIQSDSTGYEQIVRSRKKSSFNNKFGRLKKRGNISNKPKVSPGEEFLYGIFPVYTAIRVGRRGLKELFVQESLLDNTSRKKKESPMVQKIIDICEQSNIPLQSYSKHDLNMLSDNKPHQGLVLRTNTLTATPIKSLSAPENIRCVLALDEVSDPQNLGALLRSYYFLFGQHVKDKVGVVLCQKNSAPLSPAVSKASAGALEAMQIHSVKNMMKFLDLSKGNGWQVVGASLPDGAKEAAPLPDPSEDKPMILVLGNEGHGLRTNVLNRCDSLIAISNNLCSSDNAEKEIFVDSLNVSVSGGILLHHIMTKYAAQQQEK